MKYLLTAGLLLLCCAPEVPAGSLIDQQFAAKFDQIKGLLKYVFIPKIKVKENVFKMLNFKNLQNLVLSSDIPLSLTIKNLSLSLDYMELEGHYHIEDLSLPGNISVFGDGKLKVRLEGISFMMTGKFERCKKYNANCGVRYCLKNMTESDKLDVSITSATLNLGNLMGGGAVGDLLNNLISTVLPSIIEMYKPLVLACKKLRIALVTAVDMVLQEVALTPPNDKCPPKPKPDSTQLSEEILLNVQETIGQLFEDLDDAFQSQDPCKYD